jgi:hypothetical protein
VAYTQDQEGVAAGKLHKFTSPKLVKKAETIPAVLGTEFGVRYVLVETSKGEKTNVTESRIHPELKNPGSQKALNTFEYMASAETGKQLYSAYKFEAPWEFVPGIWTFHVTHEGKMQEASGTRFHHLRTVKRGVFRWALVQGVPLDSVLFFLPSGSNRCERASRS